MLYSTKRKLPRRRPTTRLILHRANANIQNIQALAAKEGCGSLSRTFQIFQAGESNFRHGQDDTAALRRCCRAFAHTVDQGGSEQVGAVGNWIGGGPAQRLVVLGPYVRVLRALRVWAGGTPGP